MTTKTTAIIAASLIAAVAIADLIPRQNFTSDTSQPSTSRTLTFNEAGSQKLGWTFKQGVTAKDLTTATLTTFTYVHPDGDWSQVVTGALDVATNGSVLVTFSPAQLNTNSTDGGIFPWILKVTDGTLTMAYARGKLNLIADPTSGVTNVFPTASSTINWSDYPVYLNTASEGPYRAGSNVTFNANADGSVDVDVTVSGDSCFTNTIREGDGIDLTGAITSGDNTIAVDGSVVRTNDANYVAAVTNGTANIAGTFLRVGVTNRIMSVVYDGTQTHDDSGAINLSGTAISSGIVADQYIAATIARITNIVSATNTVLADAKTYTDVATNGLATSAELIAATNAAVATASNYTDTAVAALNIEDLLNVDSVASPTEGNLLTWVGSSWTNQANAASEYATNTTHIGQTEIVTNFTAAGIQAALNSVGDNGEIICTPGTYVFTDTGVTNVSTNVTISAYGCVWDASAGQDTIMFGVNGKSDIHLKGASLIGVKDADETVGIGDNNIASIRFKMTDVTVRDANDHGVYLHSGGSDGFVFTRCHVYNSDDSGYFTYGDGTYTDCTSSTNDNDGYACAGVTIGMGSSAYNNKDDGVNLSRAGSSWIGGIIQNNYDNGMEVSQESCRVVGVLFSDNGMEQLRLRNPRQTVVGCTFLLSHNGLSLIHISEPTRRYAISYAVFCLKKKKLLAT